MIYKIFSNCLRCLTEKQILLLIIAYGLTFLSTLLNFIGLLTFLPLVGSLYGSNNSELLSSFNLEFLSYYIEGKPIIFFLKIIFIIFLIKHLILITSKYFILKIEKKIFVDMSTGLLEIFTFFPLKKFNEFKQSALLQYILNESRNFAKLSTTCIGLIFECLFLIFLVLIFFINGDSKILVSFIFIGSILILFTKISKNRLKILGIKKIFFGKKLYSLLISILNLYKENTLFRKKIFFNQSFYNFADKFQSNRNSIDFLKALPSSIFELSIIIVLIFYFKISLSENIDNTILLDQLILMAIILYRLYPTYANLQNNLNSILVYKRCLDELYYYFLKVKFSLIKKKKFGKILDKVKYKEINQIDFKNVKIFFKNKKISIPDFQARKGQIILVKGKSGCGKSTLSYLISGLLLPTKGKIKINNKFSINNHELMRNFGNIGYCSQNTYLFEDTIKENILFGSNSIFDQIKYENSIDIAQCRTFLKNSINRLSGGEKQRVGIARAIYNSDDLLILDEPTSNLDKNTAEKFIIKLNQIKKDKIIIFISHKSEKTLKFDKIIKF